MKGSWQRWTAAGLLLGGLLGAGGCITKDDSEDTGPFRTPLQDKYQSPAAGAASNVGTGGSGGHPSPQPDEQATKGQTGGGTLAPHDSRLLGEGQGGSGRDSFQDGMGVGLGAGLAESYDAAPAQGVDPAMEGAGRQPQLNSDKPQGSGAHPDTGGLSGGGEPRNRTPGGD
jgi:hypothetical protein